jgi:hypothetical protein
MGLMGRREGGIEEKNKGKWKWVGQERGEEVEGRRDERGTYRFLGLLLEMHEYNCARGE